MREPVVRLLCACCVACWAACSVACSGAPPAMQPTSAPSADRAADPITARGLFCTYGGVGIVPVPPPPDAETIFVSQVFEVDNPGPPQTGVTLADASVRDAAGAILAPLSRLEHFVDLSSDPPPDPTWGSFAVFLNGAGRPFDGTLPSGTTRLRIRYAISGSGAGIDHCHAALAGIGPTPLSIESPVDGVLPSS